jgi:hypothetical protein
MRDASRQWRFVGTLRTRRGPQGAPVGDVDLARRDQTGAARARVVREDRRVLLLEPKGEPLPHDTDAVDGVHERLDVRAQEIAAYEIHHGATGSIGTTPGQVARNGTRRVSRVSTGRRRWIEAT